MNFHHEARLSTARKESEAAGEAALVGLLSKPLPERRAALILAAAHFRNANQADRAAHHQRRADMMGEVIRVAGY